MTRKEKEKIKVEKEKNEEESLSPEKTKKLNRQVFYLIGTMIFLIAVFLISYYFFQSMNKFEYDGLLFTIQRVGGVSTGSTISESVPIYHYYYYFTDKDNKIIKYNLYLRYDPRKNNIPVEADRIVLNQDEKVYISVNSTGLQNCSHAAPAISTLTLFLLDNDIPVKGAVPTVEAAKRLNMTYATCETNPNNVVINLRSAEKSSIVKHSDNCYTINVANCEVIQAVEKFQVKAVADAKRREAERLKSRSQVVWVESNLSDS